jgi:hypothetical protein
MQRFGDNGLAGLDFFDNTLYRSARVDKTQTGY